VGEALEKASSTASGSQFAIPVARVTPKGGLEVGELLDFFSRLVLHERFTASPQERRGRHSAIPCND
jgi:hypothetical protein